jgi:hypothetical protein
MSHSSFSCLCAVTSLRNTWAEAGRADHRAGSVCSLCAAIGGSGSDGGSCERGFDRRTVQTLPVPADACQFIILLQPGLPPMQEKTLAFPPAKTVGDGATGTQFTRQGIPLDACLQDGDDRWKQLPIIGGWSSSFRVSRTTGKQMMKVNEIVPSAAMKRADSANWT